MASLITRLSFLFRNASWFTVRYLRQKSTTSCNQRQEIITRVSNFFLFPSIPQIFSITKQDESLWEGEDLYNLSMKFTIKAKDRGSVWTTMKIEPRGLWTILITWSISHITTFSMELCLSASLAADPSPPPIMKIVFGL